MIKHELDFNKKMNEMCFSGYVSMEIEVQSTNVFEKNT